METELHSSIQLPRSRLSVSDGALIRLSADGEVTASLPIGEIDQVRVVRVVSWAAILAGLALIIAGVFVWSFPQSETLRWIGSLSCSLLGSLALLGARYPVLLISSTNGALSFALSDEDEDIRGFVLNLEHLQARKMAIG